MSGHELQMWMAYDDVTARHRKEAERKAARDAKRPATLGG